MRVAFLGPPGAGKGTQARELAREWGVPHVATGDMLRDAAAAGTPLGREAKGYMDKGALVPDEVIIRMIAERLRRPDAGRGFLLDGFPRTIAQAEGLEHLLKEEAEEQDFARSPCPGQQGHPVAGCEGAGPEDRQRHERLRAPPLAQDEGREEHTTGRNRHEEGGGRPSRIDTGGGRVDKRGHSRGDEAGTHQVEVGSHGP